MAEQNIPHLRPRSEHQQERGLPRESLAVLVEKHGGGSGRHADGARRSPSEVRGAGASGVELIGRGGQQIGSPGRDRRGQ